MKSEALFDMSMNCMIFCFTMHISVEAFFTLIFMIALQWNEYAVMIPGVIKLNIHTVHNSKVKQYDNIKWCNINLLPETLPYAGVYPFKVSEYKGFSGKSTPLSSNWILIWFAH